mmetsp:Transcript_108709/g.249265  ORF Transcript_108709/g.249265 Transcript_108709/m.249265 type:complete len:404 (-) Transcript_108709:1075-2286(-)
MFGVTLVSRLRSDRTSRQAGSPARKAFTPASETKVSETSTCTDCNVLDKWSASTPIASSSTQHRANPSETRSATAHIAAPLGITAFVKPTQPVTSKDRLVTDGSPPRNVFSPASEMQTHPERVTSSSSSASGRNAKGVTSLRLVHSKKSNVSFFKSPGSRCVKFVKPASVISLPGTASTNESKLPGKAFASASKDRSEMRELELRSPTWTSSTSMCRNDLITPAQLKSRSTACAASMSESPCTCPGDNRNRSSFSPRGKCCTERSNGTKSSQQPTTLTSNVVNLLKPSSTWLQIASVKLRHPRRSNVSLPSDPASLMPVKSPLMCSSAHSTCAPRNEMLRSWTTERPPGARSPPPRARRIMPKNVCSVVVITLESFGRTQSASPVRVTMSMCSARLKMAVCDK